MNPLCCIAPVSIEKDRTNSPSSVVVRSQSECQLGFESSVRSVRPASFSAQVSSVGTESDNVIHEVEDSEIEVREKDSSVSKSMVFCGNGGGAVAGILYKWVNYGKGWRSRWFTLEDGVLSYYKTHGPDKILLSPGREKVIKVIGEESIRYMRKCSNGSNHNRFCAKQWKPYGEIHLKVSSVRASKSDDKRLSIFSGTKTLHLRCISREDRGAWIESLVAAKDKFPRLLSPGDLAPSEDMVISTEKLRSRLSQEGIAEEVIKDCESIMLGELSALQNQMKALQLKHIVLLDTLRQLETEKIELETTVVDETKERDSSCGQDRRFSDFYSIMSEGSGSDSDADNESQYGVNVESDEENGTFFDTNEFMSSDVLRCASYRSRDNNNNHCISNERDRDTFPSNRLLLREAGTEISLIQYPHIKRRESLPEPKEKEKPVGLWSIIKDNIGKDLSGVCLPVYFNEPLSSLQKCFEDLEYSCLVDRALEWGKQGNDLMRILSIAAFAVSGYASTEGRQCKPFNPLLGETYEADYPDKGLRFFSEKVSHHPMIVACHCEGRGWKFWADSNLKGKFWGRSIQLDPVGVLTLQFEDGETFQWSKVTTSIYNIILGKIYCDHYGTMRIKGSGNYSCKLKFKEQSIIDRNPHQVHGFVHDNRSGEKVAMLMGKWDEAMYYVLGDPTTKPKGYDPMSEAVLLWERDKSATKTRYNLTPFAISLNEVTPGLRERLPPTDSRLRPDQRHLENGEYELANAEKLRLEQLQRQARKVQERGWRPRWFSKDEDGCFHYVGGYWETRGRRDARDIPRLRLLGSQMLVDSPALKRRRFAVADQLAMEKLVAAKQTYGREIRVFETTTATISQTSNDVSGSEEPDDLEFTTADYYRILATKKEDKYLKTKKIRDAETAASRSRITKAVIRVRFPDNHTLEATFHPTETMQSLVDLLVKVVARPDLPFYIYTIPPKKQIKNMSQDFYSAGFAPGAIVYFSYDLPQGQGDDTIVAQGPFLKEDVMALKDLDSLIPDPDQPAPEPVVMAATPVQKPAGEKKMVKPKWLKM